MPVCFLGEIVLVVNDGEMKSPRRGKWIRGKVSKIRKLSRPTDRVTYLNIYDRFYSTGRANMTAGGWKRDFGHRYPTIITDHLGLGTTGGK